MTGRRPPLAGPGLLALALARVLALSSAPSPASAQSLHFLHGVLRDAAVPGFSAAVVDLSRERVEVDNRTRELDGEAACEGHAYTQPECEAVGCCEWAAASAACFSGVGTAACGDVDVDGASWAHHYGYARLGCSTRLKKSTWNPPGVNTGGVPCAVDDDTVFGLGGVSEVLVAAAVMRAVEGKHVDLDEPIETYLASRSTSYAARKLPSVWAFNDPQDMVRRITLRQLLSHTACVRDSPTVRAKMVTLGDHRTLLGSFLREALAHAMNWRAGCTLGESFEHSALGLALATHVIEYMDPAIASDFPAYGRDSLLPGFGVTNAGWKLSHLVNPGALAESYGYNVDESRVAEMFPYLYPSRVSRFQMSVFENVCPVYYPATNGTEATNTTSAAEATNASWVDRSCPGELGVLTEPTADKYFIKYGAYGKVDAPGTMLRASARQLSKVLYTLMDDGYTPEGSAFMNMSQVREMSRPQFVKDGKKSAAGLGWQLETADGRYLATADTGYANPGMAASVSFNPETGVGLILLGNADMALDVVGSPLQRDSTLLVEDALKEIRDYLYDWYESNYHSYAAPAELELAPGTAQYYHAAPPVAGEQGVAMQFKTGNYGESTVEYKVLYANLSTELGHFIEIQHGSTIISHFPIEFPPAKQETVPVNGTSVAETTNFTGYVEGTLDGMYAGTTYLIEARIVDAQGVVLLSDTHEATTLGGDAGSPPMSVELHLSCRSLKNSTLVDYRIDYVSADVTKGMNLNLAHVSFWEDDQGTNQTSGLLKPEVRMSTFHLTMATSSLTGTVAGIEPGAEYTFSADLIDQSKGTWESANTNITCRSPGKDLCEGKGHRPSACSALGGGCCEFAGGECWWSGRECAVV